MPAVFNHARVVLDSEIDRQGHVNNVAFIRWMQDAAVAHSAEQGWTDDRYEEAGFGWVARSHHIEYLASAFLGEPIIVMTWVASFSKATSSRRYRIWNADTKVLLAKAETVWAFVSLTTGKPGRINPEVSAAFEAVDENDERYVTVLE